MLSRLFPTSSSISLTTTVRFLQFSVRNTARVKGNSTGAIKIGLAVRKTGRTIKERLLAPSSEKPLIIGAAAVAATAVYGIGSLLYYSFFSRKDSILQQSNFWSDTVRYNIFSTYAYLFGSLGITAGSAVVASRLPALMRIANKSFIYTLSSVLVCVVVNCCCQEVPYDSQKLLKHTLWIFNCALFGIFTAPLCLLGGPVLIRAAGYTAGIVAGLSATAIVAPFEKYLQWFSPLGMAVGVMLMANLGLFHPKIPPNSVLGTNLISIVFFGGLVLFSLLLLHDTQRLVKVAEDHERRLQTKKTIRAYDPITQQMPIFFDVVNLFIRIVTFCSLSSK